MLNIFAQVGRLMELYYTFNERLFRLEEQMRRAEEGIDVIQQTMTNLQARIPTLEAENKSLRTTVADLTTRVAVLEEARNTVDARVRAVIAETIAEMRVQFIQAQQIQLPPPETPTKQKRRKKGV